MLVLLLFVDASVGTNLRLVFELRIAFEAGAMNQRHNNNNPHRIIMLIGNGEFSIGFVSAGQFVRNAEEDEAVLFPQVRM